MIIDWKRKGKREAWEQLQWGGRQEVEGWMKTCQACLALAGNLMGLRSLWVCYFVREQPTDQEEAQRKSVCRDGVGEECTFYGCPWWPGAASNTKQRRIYLNLRAMSNIPSSFTVTETSVWRVKNVPMVELRKCGGTVPGPQCSLTLEPLILLFRDLRDNLVLTSVRPASWKVE